MAVSHRSKHWGFVVVCVPWSVKNEPATIIGLYCLSNRDRLIQFQLIYWLLTMCPSINPSFNFVLKTAYLLKACYILGTFLGSGEQSRKGLSSQGVHILVGRKTVNKIWTNKEYQRVVRKEEGKKKKRQGKQVKVIRDGLSEKRHPTSSLRSRHWAIVYWFPQRVFSLVGETHTEIKHILIL